MLLGSDGLAGSQLQERDDVSVTMRIRSCNSALCWALVSTGFGLCCSTSFAQQTNRPGSEGWFEEHWGELSCLSLTSTAQRFAAPGSDTNWDLTFRGAPSAEDALRWWLAINEKRIGGCLADSGRDNDVFVRVTSKVGQQTLLIRPRFFENGAVGKCLNKLFDEMRDIYFGELRLNIFSVSSKGEIRWPCGKASKVSRSGRPKER
jgi:hypothetical protein